MPDDWNINSLKEYILAIFQEREKALQAALSTVDKATVKAERIAELWRASANEWRAAMSDKDSTYLTKDAAEQRFKSLEQSITLRMGQSSGMATFWGYIVQGITLFGVIIAIILALKK